MPQLTANPSVGDTVTDSGWQYRWIGDRWVSDGFVQDFNPLASFRGPFSPARTMATQYQIFNTDSSQGSTLTDSPFGGNANNSVRGTSNPFSLNAVGTVPTMEELVVAGAWVVHGFGSTAQRFGIVFPAIAENPAAGTTTAAVATGATDFVGGVSMFSGASGNPTAGTLVNTPNNTRFDDAVITVGRHQGANQLPGVKLFSSSISALGVTAANAAATDRVSWTTSAGATWATDNAGRSYNVLRGDLIVAMSFDRGNTLITGTDGLITGDRTFQVYAMSFERS